MAKVYLDTYIIIDLIEGRGDTSFRDLLHQDLFISPLSIHILMYITKKRVPYLDLEKKLMKFHLIAFTHEICQHALGGPTKDFEDNVQLHSAAEAECDIFLTSDKTLLSLAFFGKTHLLPSLS